MPKEHQHPLANPSERQPDPAAIPSFADALGGKRPFLIGIGGCGMSALARVLASGGLSVSGSDTTPSPVTRSLSKRGITVGHEQTAEALPEDIDVVIASAAVPLGNPQALEAQRRGLEVLSYAEALGRCMLARTGVCIAGTHGKSTTAAMLGCVLTDAGLDPSVIVGANCAQLAGGALAAPEAPSRHDISDEGDRDIRVDTGGRLGASRVPVGIRKGLPGLLVAESCEFNRSFHHHRPVVASIANVEADHLDIYGSLDEVVRAFAEFAERIAPRDRGGLLLIGHDGAHRREIAAGLGCDVETIGFAPAADWCVAYDAEVRRASIAGPRGVSCAWDAVMPGEHNAMNAAVAAILAIRLGADPEVVGRSLSAFRGLDRRMQLLGVRTGVRVYDDYGHHPTEIDLTLRALRAHERPSDHGGRLIVVFQPHQHSRTRFLLEEFATSFSQADIVIVPHIYFVRDSEAEKQRVSSADLVDRLRGRGVRAMHLYPFEAIVEQLENVCRPGDLLVVMGAGPVWQVARGYLDAGSARDRAGAIGAPAIHTTGKTTRVDRIPTWFGVGGGATSYAEPETVDDLRRILANEDDVRMLGDGANLIVADEGIGATVVKLASPAFCGIEMDEATGLVGCGAGVKLPSLIGRVARAGLAGIEGLSGIPATLGGAVRMNAGGRFGEISSAVRTIHGIDASGDAVELSRDEAGFGYRKSGLSGLVLTRVDLDLRVEQPERVLARRANCMAIKTASQPLSERSGGCWFRNPTLGADLEIEGTFIAEVGDRVSAGLLIDRAGCKGLAFGSATVSRTHANFIVVAKDGAANDAIALGRDVAARVLDRFGVTLQREVVVWGDGE